MRNRGRLAVLLLTGAAVLAAGCRAETPVSSTAATVAAGTAGTDGGQNAEIDGDFLTRGSSNTMVETGSRLFFKYENGKSSGSFWSLDKGTGELTKLYELEEGQINSLFWYEGGNLYFDCAPSPDTGLGERIGLYRLKIGSENAERLADLSALPSILYVSDGILYVKGYGMEQFYTLREDGSLDEEIPREKTIYGKMPEGCEDLYRESLPAIVERCGYMAVQRNGALVIADRDGTNVREVPEVTGFSNLVFDTDGFYAVVNREGKNEICRYDLESLKPQVLLETGYPTLLQCYEGSLYYIESGAGDPFKMENRIYCLNVGEGGAAGGGSESGAQLVSAMEMEPGTSGFYGYYGNFYVSDGWSYRQKIHEYDVFIERTPLKVKAEGDAELLEPAVYRSHIGELGHVEAEEKDLPCSCGEKTAARYYVERFVLDGDSQAAAAMNEVMGAAADAEIRYGEGMVSSVDEAWVHSEEYAPTTLQYQIGGVTYLDSRYCSIEADGYEYVGGSHGMPFKNYFVFDRETGKRLELPDILSTSEEELKTIVGAHFRRYAERTGDTFETPEELEATVNGRVSYRSPFYLTEKGIVFFFTPYDIAPYAAGFPEVTVPYEELELKIQLGKEA